MRLQGGLAVDAAVFGEIGDARLAVLVGTPLAR
jgi:hypothetical protein